MSWDVAKRYGKRVQGDMKNNGFPNGHTQGWKLFTSGDKIIGNHVFSWSFVAIAIAIGIVLIHVLNAFVKWIKLLFSHPLIFARKVGIIRNTGLNVWIGHVKRAYPSRSLPVMCGGRLTAGHSATGREMQVRILPPAPSTLWCEPSQPWTGKMFGLDSLEPGIELEHWEARKCKTQNLVRRPKSVESMIRSPYDIEEE